MKTKTVCISIVAMLLILTTGAIQAGAKLPWEESGPFPDPTCPIPLRPSIPHPTIIPGFSPGYTFVVVASYMFQTHFNDGSVQNTIWVVLYEGGWALNIVYDENGNEIARYWSFWWEGLPTHLVPFTREVEPNTGIRV